MMVCQNLPDMNNNQTSRFQQFPISERTVKRLRNYGQFPEDVDTVINRVIDQLESFGVRDWSDDLLVDKRRRFDSGALPDVTFSRLFHARIADKEINRPSWNGLVAEIIESISRDCPEFSSLEPLRPLSTRPGKQDETQWHYIESADISFCRCSAFVALKFINRAAAILGEDIILSIQWYNNPKALFPGESAMICLQGNKAD